MFITKLLLSISITVLFINQIVIILEKEKLEKKLNIILKIANGEPLTKEERKHARKLK